MPRTRLLLALLALVALMTTLAACGDDEGDEAEQAATGTIETSCIKDDLDTIEAGLVLRGNGRNNEITGGDCNDRLVGRAWRGRRDDES